MEKINMALFIGKKPMQRTNIIKLKPSKKQKKILKEMCLLSSCIYNSSNYIIRQQFFKKEKVSGFFDLQQKLQKTEDYKLLGRSYSLPRIQVYSETNSARFKLIKSKSQKKVGLPKYLKNRKTNTTIPSYLVIDNCQYSIKKNYVMIPLSRVMRKKYNIKHFHIKYNGILKWNGLQKRGQIKFKDNFFYFHQSVELKPKLIKKSKIKVGVDLGIKRLISMQTNNSTDKQIGGKRFYNHWKYLTRLIGKEQSKLMLQNKIFSKNLTKLFNKRKKWQNNLFNNVISKMFKFINKNNVSEIVVGDIKNIRYNNNKGKRFNRMVHNYWSFDLLFKKIKNKAEEFGIKLTTTTEEYTSRTCPICCDNNKSNCKDRIFICSYCGYIDDRDRIGARNILLKSMYGSLESIHWNEAVPFGVVV